MDARDLKKWRKRLGYNQFEAAKRLGVRRASIQNWEQELSPIPRVVELACHQLMRSWKQRREFGPVLLVYTDEPIWQPSERPYHISILYSAVYANNETAMQHANRLKNDPYFINPVILESNGAIIWTTSELLQELAYESRRHARARRRGNRVM
jgi:DNA-binding XRE family transcriptional regulator